MKNKNDNLDNLSQNDEGENDENNDKPILTTTFSPVEVHNDTFEERQKLRFKI